MTADELFTVALPLLKSDRFAAVELLEAQNPTLAAAVYKKLQLELFWKARDLPTMIAISQAGIQHALAASTRSADAAEVESLRSAAKAMAYNLASFTWRGWNEADVAPTRADELAGYDAARLNLRLAEELNKPDKAKANAYWVLAAHRLAAGEHDLAAQTFRQGTAFAQAANDAVQAHMLEGYARLVEVVAAPDDPNARTAFEATLESLETDNTNDARAYIKQLTSAVGIF